MCIGEETTVLLKLGAILDLIDVYGLVVIVPASEEMDLQIGFVVRRETRLRLYLILTMN